MDNHPIPQDVTGFQFKLIGNMTVKQFAYVAVGVVLAVVCFYLKPLGLFRFLFMLFFGGLGSALAFLPIEGRPLDLMLSNFVKALFSPNQYLFAKQGGKLAISLIPTSPTVTHPQAAAKVQQHKTNLVKRQELQTFLHQMDTGPKNDMDLREIQKMQSLASLVGMAPTQSPMQSSAMPQPQAQPSPIQAMPSVQMPTPIPQHAQETPQPMTTPAVKPQAVDTDTAVQIENIEAQKAQLKDELSSIRQTISSVHSQATQPQPISVTPIAAPQPVQIPQPPIAPASAQVIQTPPPVPPVSSPKQPFIAMTKPLANTSKPAGIVQRNYAAPAAPNIIIGNIKDSRGNALANILVEIRDKDNNPIRAFKTNVLGQFASATPLRDGVYTIELEDPRAQHTFQPIQIEAKNEIISPLEIVSHDAREALRQELFT